MDLGSSQRISIYQRDRPKNSSRRPPGLHLQAGPGLRGSRLLSSWPCTPRLPLKLDLDSTSKLELDSTSRLDLDSFGLHLQAGSRLLDVTSKLDLDSWTSPPSWTWIRGLHLQAGSRLLDQAEPGLHLQAGLGLLHFTSKLKLDSWTLIWTPGLHLQAGSRLLDFASKLDLDSWTSLPSWTWTPTSETGPGGIPCVERSGPFVRGPAQWGEAPTQEPGRRTGPAMGSDDANGTSGRT
jgi:hypothetical protein